MIKYELFLNKGPVTGKRIHIARDGLRANCLECGFRKSGLPANTLSLLRSVIVVAAGLALYIRLFISSTPSMMLRCL